MRVGIDVRPLTVPTFGIGRYTRELVNRLVDLAESTEWFLYADRPILEPPVHDNVTIRSFPAHNRIMSLGRTQLTFSHWANRDKLDVFWSPRHHLPLFLDPSIKRLLTIHDLVWRKFPETMQPANVFVERLLMGQSLQQADKVIAVSHSTRDDLIAELAVDDDKIEVIYEAAGLVSEPNPDREIEASYFLFVGTHEPRKNLKRLVEAFQIYQVSGGKVELVIVGASGWGESNELAAQNIRALGYVSDARLNGLLSHATALLLPSLYEGFGLPLVESMQRRVPVITSNISSMPEIAGQAGLLVDPLDVNSIATAMSQMEDEITRNKLIAACEDQSARFSWDIAAESTLQLIEAVAAR